ncbi:MAG TPA: UDP-N-acetylglucosamine 2-epimerase (non-hydrolyzing) [Anaerolineales bacterium]|nr:UDP-N-acetylglucosamine 2-epimerase (non-hydrolyzing) [Anaerolineales bacterium]
MTIRVLSIFGTRPEAVKMAPVIRELKRSPGVDSYVCVTAQHREMLDQVLNLFRIKPDIDLDLMRPDQTLADLSAAIFTQLDPVLKSIKPEWVLVQGDTTTVAVASMLAYYRRIKVGHVEAGLRTFDKWQPYPEEINRRIAGVIADLHFAPTEWTRRNLLREGVSEDSIKVTGNPVIDALQVVAEQPAPSQVKELVNDLFLNTGKRLILVTAHRRENFGKPLQDIIKALIQIAARGDVEIVYPVHLNPNVQEPVYRMLGETQHITLLPPLDYLPMVHLLKQAALVLTDSGGIQEEAPAFGIPVLVLREVTERPEGVESGTLKLVGTDTDRIVGETNKLLDDPLLYSQMAKASNPFGDGHAAERIVKALLEYRTKSS